jgi:hypothetical protein
MRALDQAYRLRPDDVRDLVGGTGGVTVCSAAVILGCAFGSPGVFVWFAFFGLLGVTSLATSVPSLRNVRHRFPLAPVESERLRKAA